MGRPKSCDTEGVEGAIADFVCSRLRRGAPLCNNNDLLDFL